MQMKKNLEHFKPLATHVFTATAQPYHEHKQEEKIVSLLHVSQFQFTVLGQLHTVQLTWI